MLGSRIPLSRCRDLLGAETQLSEPELEDLVERLYSLADLVVSLQEDLNRNGPISSAAPDEQSEFDSCLQQIPSEDQEAIEERAAIREYDGDQSREVAERSALSDYLGKSIY